MAGEYEAYDVMMIAHKMESMRGGIRIRRFIVTILFLATTACWFLGPFIEALNDDVILPLPFFSIIPFMIAFIIAILGSGKEREFKELFKTEFVPRVLKTMFDNVEYIPEKGFLEKNVEVMKVVRPGNRYKTEDFIAADYKGVHFQRADVYVAYRTSSGKNGQTTEYFNGRIYQVMFNKMLAGGVQIRSKNYTYYEMPEYLDKTCKVQMENQQFNSMFDVFASTQQDAFYVLTPQVMEKLMYVNQKFKQMCIMIVGNRLILAGKSSLDGLEPQIKRSVEYEIESVRIKEELREITDIIDSLSLDNRTFIYNGL